MTAQGKGRPFAVSICAFIAAALLMLAALGLWGHKHASPIPAHTTHHPAQRPTRAPNTPAPPGSGSGGGGHGGPPPPPVTITPPPLPLPQVCLPGVVNCPK